MSGYIFPLFLAVVVGGLVNLWAGLVTVDLVTFRTILRDAAAFMDASKTKPLGMGSAMMRVYDFSAQLREIGQLGPAAQLDELGLRYFEQLQIKPILSRISQLVIIEPNDPLPADLQAELDTLNALAIRVRKIRPAYIRLFSFRLSKSRSP
jgi:hypothetical protein